MIFWLLKETVREVFHWLCFDYEYFKLDAYPFSTQLKNCHYEVFFSLFFNLLVLV